MEFLDRLSDYKLFKKHLQTILAVATVILYVYRCLKKPVRNSKHFASLLKFEWLYMKKLVQKISRYIEIQRPYQKNTKQTTVASLNTTSW